MPRNQAKRKEDDQKLSGIARRWPSDAGAIIRAGRAGPPIGLACRQGQPGRGRVSDRRDLVPQTCIDAHGLFERDGCTRRPAGILLRGQTVVCRVSDFNRYLRFETAPDHGLKILGKVAGTPS